VLDLDFPNLFWGPVVSPDGATILYVKDMTHGQDLTMIENFRLSGLTLEFPPVVMTSRADSRVRFSGSREQDRQNSSRYSCSAPHVVT
jgi:hypothetical protein